VEYDETIFNTDGTTKDGFSFYYTGEHLALKYNDKNYMEFGIRPMKSNIRPGDDILLSFDLLIDNKIVHAPGVEEDSLGVYDEKMLWRANLYIKEDSDDWNDRNPWDAPPSGTIEKGSFTRNHKRTTFKQATLIGNNIKLITDDSKSIWYGHNEWNVKYDGKVRLDSTKIEPDETDYLTYLRNLPNNKGDGKQVVKFNSYTNIPSITGSKTESNVVAYSYGSSDSPFEFNDELLQQKEFRNNYYSKTGHKFTIPRDEWPPEGINTYAKYKEFIDQDYTGSEADYNNNIGIIEDLTENSYTKAWGNDYNNYTKPSEFYTGLPNELLVNQPAPSVSTITDGKTFPFLPGWALEYYFRNGNQIPDDWINAISSGVDCNGFTSRAVAYHDNPYFYGNSRNQKVTNKNDWFTTPQYPYYVDKYKNSRGVTINVEIQSDLISKNIIGDYPVHLDKIRPGDFMYTQTSGGQGKHIALVLAVKYSDDMKLEDIKLIESTWFDKVTTNIYKYAKVVSEDRTLNNYVSSNWVVVRPRIK